MKYKIITLIIMLTINTVSSNPIYPHHQDDLIPSIAYPPHDHGQFAIQPNTYQYLKKYYRIMKKELDDDISRFQKQKPTTTRAETFFKLYDINQEILDALSSMTRHPSTHFSRLSCRQRYWQQKINDLQEKNFKLLTEINESLSKR